MLVVLSIVFHLGCHLGTVLVPKRLCPRHLSAICKIQGLFTEITSYFAVTLVVASCVLVQGSRKPTLYELTFTTALVNFQLSLQTIHVLIGLTPPPLPTDLAMAYPLFERIWHRILFGLNSILTIVPAVSFNQPGRPFKQQEAVLDPCGLNWGLGSGGLPFSSVYSFNAYFIIFLPWFFPLMAAIISFLQSKLALAVPGTEPSTGSSLWMAMSKGAAWLLSWERTVTLPRLMVVICMHALIHRDGPIGVMWVSIGTFVLAGICILFKPCELRFQTLARATHDWEDTVKRKLALEYDVASVNTLVILTLLGWLIADAQRHLFTMARLRDDLHRIRQKNDTQGEWGVGQVGALVAWLPLLPHLIKTWYAHRPVSESTGLSLSTRALPMTLLTPRQE